MAITQMDGEFEIATPETAEAITEAIQLGRLKFVSTEVEEVVGQPLVWRPCVVYMGYRWTYTPERDPKAPYHCKSEAIATNLEIVEGKRTLEDLDLSANKIKGTRTRPLS